MDLYKLFETVYDFSRKDRPMYRFAKRKHDDTKAVRKHSGEPYFVHPEAVAKVAMAYNGTDLEIKAALAHDTVEDAGATIEDIEEKFGKDVAKVVSELTNDTMEIKKLGKEEYMNQKLVNLSEHALFVKLCDINANTTDYPTADQATRMFNNLMYLKEHRKLSKHVEELFEDTLEILAYKISNLVSNN